METGSFLMRMAFPRIVRAGTTAYAGGQFPDHSGPARLACRFQGHD
jgi:hypothetical protein